MEASSITTEPAIEDEALKSLLDTFGSQFSLDKIASAFCNAGRDSNLAAEILCGMQTGPTSSKMHASDGISSNTDSSQVSADKNFTKSWHANGNRSNVSTVKTNPASVGTVSSVLGKKYVWRVPGSNGTKPTKVNGNEFCIPHHPTNRAKDTSLSPSEATSVSGDANLSPPEATSLSRNANLSPPEPTSLSRDANLNEDIVNFLFEMLGRGFQLERGAIQEVLGNCGYDMKKSLETLLDLTAATLDRRNNIHKGSNLPSNFRAPSRNRLPTQNIAQSNRRGSSGMQPNGRYEQQKEILTSLFHAPGRPDVTASGSAAGSADRSGTRTVVCEPLEDIPYELKAISVRLHIAHTKDEADEDAYQILRKAVKEHRNTMREYYKASAEAFASGDRARAALLLEKGQYFNKKAREADEESALKIFETSSGGGEAEDDMSLDLQDLDAKEAIKLVKCHLRSLSGIPSMTNLKILIGNGDQRDVQKRRRLVKKLLEREAIKWDEDENLGTLLVRLDEIDPKSLSFARN